MATVLITGANRGIGLALTGAFLANGDDVLTMNVAQEASVAKAAATLRGKPIDIVVNNAGVLNDYGGIADGKHDEAAWRDVLMINVAGGYFVAAHFLPNLKLSKEARLIFITSGMSSLSEPGGGAYPYRASKAAVNSLTRNLALDLKADGIAVAAFDPGWVRTDMGGPDASISAEASAAGLLKRILALGPKTTGVIETYAGEKVVL